MLFVGVDIGGTFTDFALYDSETGEVAVHKLRSTPHDPALALAEGFAELCLIAGVAPERVDGVLHGTTIATNAVLEHRGALTGLITTEGMRDVVHIGRHQRPQTYSVMQDIPWQTRPFVRRAHRIGVRERIVAPDGETLVPLDVEAVRDAARRLRAEGVEAVAVCFLFSYLNPVHELRAAEIVADEMPGCFVTTSAGTSPQFREFERFTTACMNAFVGPGTATYLRRLAEELRSRGAACELLVMRSNGGLASVTEAAARPVTLMLSGPAAGVLGGQWTGGLVGQRRLITLDMGGTSTDVGLVTEAGVRQASMRDTQIAGYPILVPMFDLQTIGAGGGSIARVDDADAFTVGPRSAGASPGPACYGLGGTEATITDAHLLLGRIAADRFLGGDVRLDVDAAAQAIARLALRLGLGLTDAAEGIIALANAQMARTIRSITIERGHDPRDFTLVAFGGAGPLHAAELAALLGVPEVLIPPHPGITSAAGLLTSELRYDLMRTVFATESRIDVEAVNRGFAELTDELTERLRRDGAAPAEIRIERSLDCRYLGQGYELAIPVGEGAFTVDTLAAFHAAHEAEYGHAHGDPIEVVNLRVTATGRRPQLGHVSAASGEMESATIGASPAIWRVDGALVELETRHLLRERLPIDEPIQGPAIIFQRDTTTAVPPGWSAVATAAGPIRLTAAPPRPPALAAALGSEQRR
jgi:N-methylhydantoinase A/oxoprolinase/acetone carboxylase beta subunit